MLYEPTRSYSAKFKFEDAPEYYGLVSLLATQEIEGIYNIRLYETQEILILMGKHLPDETGYDKTVFYVVFDFETPKHYGARRWLKERLAVEPQVCWYHYYELIDKNPLEILEDEL